MKYKIIKVEGGANGAIGGIVEILDNPNDLSGSFSGHSYPVKEHQIGVKILHHNNVAYLKTFPDSKYWNLGDKEHVILEPYNNYIWI